MSSTASKSINGLQNIISNRDSDPFGNALLEFYKTKKESEITVHSPMFEDDAIPSKYLFRNIDEMPSIEQKALSLCSGRILDVGAGAGCHALELQKSGFTVTAIDISLLAVDCMHMQGVKDAQHISVMDIEGEFETILMLMNGIGIAGTTKGLEILLKKLHSILKYDGTIILDSSDICYLHELEDGSYRIDLSDCYYGEVEFQMSYKDVEGNTFKWLYIDSKTLEYYATLHGFKMKVVKTGEDGYSYLATLKKI